MSKRLTIAQKYEIINELLKQNHVTKKSLGDLEYFLEYPKTVHPVWLVKKGLIKWFNVRLCSQFRCYSLNYFIFYFNKKYLNVRLDACLLPQLFTKFMQILFFGFVFKRKFHWIFFNWTQNFEKKNRSYVGGEVMRQQSYATDDCICIFIVTTVCSKS